MVLWKVPEVPESSVFMEENRDSTSQHAVKHSLSSWSVSRRLKAEVGLHVVPDHIMGPETNSISTVEQSAGGRLGTEAKLFQLLPDVGSKSMANSSKGDPVLPVELSYKLLPFSHMFVCSWVEGRGVGHRDGVFELSVVGSLDSKNCGIGHVAHQHESIPPVVMYHSPGEVNQNPSEDKQVVPPMVFVPIRKLLQPRQYKFSVLVFLLLIRLIKAAENSQSSKEWYIKHSGSIWVFGQAGVLEHSGVESYFQGELVTFKPSSSGDKLKWSGFGSLHSGRPPHSCITKGFAEIHSLVNMFAVCHIICVEPWGQIINVNISAIASVESGQPRGRNETI